MTLPNQNRLQAWRDRYAGRPLIARHNAQILRGLDWPANRDSSGYLRLRTLDEVIADNLWRIPK